MAAALSTSSRGMTDSDVWMMLKVQEGDLFALRLRWVLGHEGCLDEHVSATCQQ